MLLLTNQYPAVHPTEEQGLSFDPDGRSFVTSVGASQSTLWVHDARGDRQITSEGFAFLPSFSADGKLSTTWFAHAPADAS